MAYASRMHPCRMLMLSVIISSAIMMAQRNTGDILGTVTDTSGAVVPGAAVTIENLGTHEKRTAQTSTSGEYVVNLLNPGVYSITVTAPAFKSFNVPALNLAAGDRARVDAGLVVGQITEIVEVQASTSALQTDSSVLSNTINQKATQDLPLNGRNFIQLVQLQPGVNEGPPDSLTNGSKLDDRRQTAAISVNGQSDVLNNQMIDGADNNERLIGTIAVRPSVEAIAEMLVQTNTYSAESGRTGGGVVNVITKSGTNDFRGSLFEFFRNDVFNANQFGFGQSLPKPELRQNQFGGSLGGPIVRNKTFFFGNYEGYRLVRGLATQISTVPTLYQRQHPGDFSDVGGSVTPASQIDPVGLDYFKMYPAPNFGTNQFAATPTEVQFSHDYDARVDHQFNANNRIFGRFIYNNVYTNTPGSFPEVTVGGVTLNPSFIGSGLGFAKDVDYNGLLNYVHIFNPNLLLELKAGYTRADNQSYPNTVGLSPNEKFGQPNVNTSISDSTGLAPIVVVSGANLGQTLFQPLKDQDNTFQYLGTVGYTRGTHNIKVGAGLTRRQMTSFQSSFPEGLWIFLDYASLVTGQYVNTQRALQLTPPHLRVWEPSFFVQDDWHVNRKLTLNLGLRYDLFTPFTEVQNQISTFDPKTGKLLIAGKDGVSNTAGIHTDYRGLAPRVGFAATLGRGLVVRGGYGISFFPMNTTSNANLKNPPFVATVSSCGVIFFLPVKCPGLKTFADGFPAIVPTTLNTPGVSIPDAVDPDFRTSYLQQFNVTVQKDWKGNVATLSYVGLVGHDLAQLFPDLNAPPPNVCGSPGSPCTNPNTLRPYYSANPNLGLVGFFQTHGKSSYNALQASIDRRLKNGLTLNANYAWAHNLDNATGLSEENAGGYGIVPSQVGTLDYGNSPLDVRHRLAATVNYALPFGKTGSGASAILTKGWQLNLVGAWSTGVPFTVVNANDTTNTNPGANNADRPNVIGDTNLPNKSTSSFFNPGAFAQQAPGTLGNEGRNALHGPSFRHLDASLFKTFSLTERVLLDLRMECFNLTNTPNFGAPNASLPAGTAPNVPPITLANIGSSTANPSHFGQITSMSTGYKPREFQIALKLHF